MAFTHSGSSTNGGTSATATTGTHGITINSGDLVVFFSNHNNTGSQTPDSDSGGTWTTEINEVPTSETARMTMAWKIATGSEPTAYTMSAGGSSTYRVVLMVFASSTDAEVDSAAVTDRGGSPQLYLQGSATNGRTVSDHCVSVVFGGKDNRGGSETYDTPNNSYLAGDGQTGDQSAGGAYRIYTTDGETMSYDVRIETADADDGVSDFAYSCHMSFLESTGGATGSTSTFMLMGVGS